MKNDLHNRTDIEFFVKHFYSQLLEDDLLKPFFKHILVEDTLDHHLEIITNFWDDLLFNADTYHRNAMKPHLKLTKKIPFKLEHFEKWLTHFNTSMDTHFKGEKATFAKTRALSIATVMRAKMSSIQ